MSGLISRTSPRLAAAAVAAMLAALAQGCTPGGRQPESGAYAVAEVTRGPVQRTIETVGVINPKDSVDVGAQVTGMVESLYVEIGDLVEQGQLLAEFDPRIAETQVEADRARLQELEGTRRQQMAELELARVRAERSQSLFDTGAVSQADNEAAQTQLEVAQAQLRRLDAQIDGAESQLQGDLTSLGYTKVYAPMSGMVTSINADEGQTLSARQTTPVLMTIADLSVMEVSVDVPEAQIGAVQQAVGASFQTTGYRDRVWEADIRLIMPEPEIVSDVVLFKVLLDADNGDRALMPNMTAQVTFDLGSAVNALRIPEQALRLGNAFFAQYGAPGGSAPFGARDERRTVLVVTEEGPQPREITIGITGDDYVEVLSGLQPGETVVASHPGMDTGNDDDFDFRGGGNFFGS